MKYKHSDQFVRVCDRIFSDAHSQGYAGTRLFLADSLFFSHDFMLSLLLELEEKYWANCTELNPLEMLGFYILASSVRLDPKEFDVFNIVDRELLSKLDQIESFIDAEEIEGLDMAQELIRQVRRDYGDFPDLIYAQSYIELVYSLANEIEGDGNE